MSENGVEFDQLSSGNGDATEPKPDTSITQNEQSEAETPVGAETDVQSSAATVNDNLQSVADSNTVTVAASCSLNSVMCPKKFVGWLWNCSVCDKNVGDIVMWTEPRLSGAVFIGGLAVLLSLTMFSIISVVAYWALILLVITVTFYVYRSIPLGLSRPHRGHPYRRFLDDELRPSSETVRHWTDVFVKYAMRFFVYIRHIVLIEDFVDSLRCAVVFWIMTYIGARFNAMTLIILFYVFIFTVPKVYLTYKVQVHDWIDAGRSQLTLAYSRIRQRIPL